MLCFQYDNKVTQSDILTLYIIGMISLPFLIMIKCK